MAYAFVQQKENSSGSTNLGSIASGNSSGNITVTNVLPWVVEYYSPASKTVTMSDTRGLTFVEVGSFYSAPDGNGKHFGYAIVTSGAALENITGTFSANVDFPGIYWGEYSGLDTAALFTSGEAVGQVQAAPGTGVGAITSGATPTLAAQPAMVFGLCSDTTVGFVPTADTAAGFTSRTAIWTTSDSQARPEDKRVTATTAVAATWTAQASHGGDAYSACVMVFKEAVAGGTVTSKTMTDTIPVTDETVTWRRRVRLLDEAAILADSFVKSVIVPGATVYTKVMSDVITVADALVKWLRRVRVPLDTVTLSDGDTYRTSIITASETIDVSDGFVSWRRLKRVAQDNIDLIDGFSKTLAGAGITYAKVMSDTVTLIDDAGQRWKRRVTQLTDVTVLSDQAIRYIQRIRVLGDVVEYTDGTVKIRRSIRSVDEGIDVTDGSVSTVYRDQISSTSFSFGSSGPPFRFGGA